MRILSCSRIFPSTKHYRYHKVQIALHRSSSHQTWMVLRSSISVGKMALNRMHGVYMPMEELGMSKRMIPPMSLRSTNCERVLRSRWTCRHTTSISPASARTTDQRSAELRRYGARTVKHWEESNSPSH